jgi:hypothetical protein
MIVVLLLVFGHDYHHDTKVKPEAATAVVGLLMMGVRTPKI